MEEAGVKETSECEGDAQAAVPHNNKHEQCLFEDGDVILSEVILLQARHVTR